METDLTPEQVQALTEAEVKELLIATIQEVKELKTKVEIKTYTPTVITDVNFIV